MPNNQNTSPLFQPGQIVITANARETLIDEDILNALDRHLNGDWGELCDSDGKLNNEAVKTGERILSAYRSSTSERFWIITEWDRSYTTVLFPSDY